MPLYLIERQFAEKLELSMRELERIEAANSEAGVQWLYSFVSDDEHKTYCIYRADDPEAIREAARLAGIPADKIIEVEQVEPGAADPDA